MCLWIGMFHSKLGPVICSKSWAEAARSKAPPNDYLFSPVLLPQERVWQTPVACPKFFQWGRLHMVAKIFQLRLVRFRRGSEMNTQILFEAETKQPGLNVWETWEQRTNTFRGVKVSAFSPWNASRREAIHLNSINLENDKLTQRA